ncbi:hypothetical protein GPL15_23700 [Clostridium sp. MCC353]|uniref:hypothetical protein n=1 Tax=Clostridium sp. MCC353 TaxID=2592646 RepID=UPI001C009BAC|nr:hypothetical protein [Clostridium sp. MCC353]MBT9779487.1 hypothetical protein [Clostridium sp. MCC353]
MKKRWLGILLTAALVAAQPAGVFAAPSPNTNINFDGGDGGDGYYDDSSTSRTTGTSAAAASAAQDITLEGTSTAGMTTIGDTKVGFVDGDAATAGLPSQTVEAIKAINAGTALSEAVKDANLSGYAALTSVRAFVMKDAATNQEKTGSTTVSLYVPNLLQNLKNVQVLFYDNHTGIWSLINPVNVDASKKTVTVVVNGSGSMSVVYQR